MVEKLGHLVVVTLQELDDRHSRSVSGGFWPPPCRGLFCVISPSSMSLSVLTSVLPTSCFSKSFWPPCFIGGCGFLSLFWFMFWFGFLLSGIRGPSRGCVAP